MSHSNVIAKSNHCLFQGEALSYNCLFVCLFEWRHSPFIRSKGHSEVKDTCLHQVKEFRKGEGTKTTHLCSCWLVKRRSCPGGTLLSPSASMAQLTGEALQPQSLSNQITFDAALRHRDSNEYRGLWRNKSSCQWHNRGTSTQINKTPIVLEGNRQRAIPIIRQKPNL